MQKVRVGIFFGGISTEHQISLWSAKSIIDNIDKVKFKIVQFYIDKQGSIWQAKNALNLILEKNLPN